ncbi:MAG: hypothetical protein IH991_12205 [Planctomycetes bacterium]|nr:hypothetical protein [Planctomycetota bacterium]
MRRILAALLIGTIAASACADQTPQGEVVLVAVADLIERAEDGTDQRFMVVGRLVNVGTNYFTDRRIILVDADSDTSIDVRAWLPLESYLAQDSNVPKPPTMAQFLNKNVELIVTSTKTPVKGIGIVPVLEVHAARILNAPD